MRSRPIRHQTNFQPHTIRVPCRGTYIVPFRQHEQNFCRHRAAYYPSTPSLLALSALQSPFGILEAPPITEAPRRRHTMLRAQIIGVWVLALAAGSSIAQEHQHSTAPEKLGPKSSARKARDGPL